MRPLAEALRTHHLDVWYDQYTMIVGDSLRDTNDRDLANLRLNIVVLNPDFFKKRWPQRVLSGPLARETAANRQLNLPLGHNIDCDEILQYSPPLADLFAVSSDHSQKRSAPIKLPCGMTNLR